jgi:hypothetical protein
LSSNISMACARPCINTSDGLSEAVKNFDNWAYSGVPNLRSGDCARYDGHRRPAVTPY